MSSRWLLVLALALAACTRGGDRPPADGDGGMMMTGSLRIEPANHTATIMAAPVELDYRAFLAGSDVTASVTWSSTNAALGTFAGAHFTSSTDFGGTTQIRASMGSETGSTTLTLRLDRAILEPGAPPDAATRFAAGTVDASRSPELVYPDDDTVVPPNLGELEFHYRPSGSTLFELHVATGSVDLRLYFGCPEAVTGGCIYTPTRPAWEAVAAAARGAGPITYTLRGIDDTGRIGVAASRTLTVAEEDITGGLYYWNALAGTIDRFEFGVRGAVAERYLDQGRTGALMCIGCHALSRDGRRIVVGTDTPTSTLQAFDVATRTRLWSTGMPSFPPSPQQPNFSAWKSDGTQLVGSSMTGLFFRDGDTGAEIAGPVGGGPSSMPDFSPDGNHIVYVRHDAPVIPAFPLYDASSVSGGRIHVLDWDGAFWSGDRELVAGSGNNFYPAFTPDGAWLVFVRSPSNVPSMGMDPSTAETAYVPDAELWMIATSGGAASRLDRADGFADSWPKWDPTRYVDQGRPLYWLAWSSRRAFGLRYEQGGKPQLWMTAFDPEAAARGEDPTHPAFRLPFQNIASGNHIAQWVTRIERMTCTGDADCGGEFCVEGRCYEQAPFI